MDEILIYDTIKFQRVVPARAKFVRFMRSQFESFSLTVKPLREKWNGMGGWRAEARMEKEKEEVEGRGWNCRGKCWGWRGNIVLNRKIGILINTRGLSIKEAKETGTRRGAEGGRERWRNDDSFRSFHPSRVFDIRLNVFSNSSP